MTPPGIGDAQRRYARVLEVGARLGLTLLVIAFGLYVAGILPAHVPLERLASVWSLPLGEYLEHTATPTGWAWLALARHGDFASLAGIAILSSCSVPCLLAVVPAFQRSGDRVHAGLCVLQVAVLALAASGIVSLPH